jgi:uncharacterized protein YcfL
MQKTAGMAMAVMALLAAGCENTPYGGHQAYSQPMQVTMTDALLQHDLKVSKAQAHRVGAGQLEVTVELYNQSDHNLPVDYQYWWVDKAGMAVDNRSGWQAIKLAPRSFQQITFTSMSALADDFRVQVRPESQ